MKLTYYANTPAEESDILHFGRRGQKWYARNFQSYSVKPTRSGKVGMEYGAAAEQATRADDKKEEKEADKQEVAEQKPVDISDETKKKESILAARKRRAMEIRLSDYNFVKKNMHRLTNDQLKYAITRQILQKDFEEVRNQAKMSKSKKHQQTAETATSAFRTIKQIAETTDAVKTVWDKVSGVLERKNNEKEKIKFGQEIEKERRKAGFETQKAQALAKTKLENDKEMAKFTAELNAKYKQNGSDTKQNEQKADSTFTGPNVSNKDGVRIMLNVINKSTAPTQKIVKDAFKSVYSQQFRIPENTVAYTPAPQERLALPEKSSNTTMDELRKRYGL